LNHEYLPVIEHAGVLEDLIQIPGFLLPEGSDARAQGGRYSCSFCGVGDSGIVVSKRTDPAPAEQAKAAGPGFLEVNRIGIPARLQCTVLEDGSIQVASSVALTPPGGTLSGRVLISERSFPVSGREVARDANGDVVLHTFSPLRVASRYEITRTFRIP
jgi:hypothetical protein